MIEEVKRDLSDSAYDFERLVWPAISKHRGGECVVVEAVSAKGLARDFDVLAGIDAWHLDRDECLMRGIASRIQWGPMDWRTFTIRKSRRSGAETEYSKRLRAIFDNPDSLFPAITSQAYITERRVGRLLSVAVANTRELYTHVRDDKDVDVRKTRADGNTFFLVPWGEYAKKYRLLVIEGERRDETEVVEIVTVSHKKPETQMMLFKPRPPPGSCYC